MILYLHQHPAIKPNEIITKRSFSPIPMDDGKCGYYGDRIFNAHNSASRFYVATFGYSKSWKDNNTHERQIDRYTIHFVYSGAGVFNGQPVRAGQMFFAPQNQKYTIVNHPEDPLTFSWIALSGTELENQLSLIHLPEKPTITFYQNADKIQQIFIDTIYGQLNDLNRELFLFSKFYETLALCNVINKPFPLPTNHHTDIYYSKIISYINIHYAQAITMSDIAKNVHISTTYMRRICKEKSGYSPQALITMKRMNVAKTLLANDDSSIEEISSLVGFANVGAFSKCFKKTVGIAPLFYRKQKAKEQKQRAQKIDMEES